MKILVTGHKGFIGKHLFKSLSSQNHTEGVDLIDGIDLRDDTVVRALGEYDMVFHLAATNGTRHFYEQPFSVLENNTVSTLNLLKRYSGTKTKFIFASTCEVFSGAVDSGFYPIPTDEAVPVHFSDPLNPRWSYSLPKALGENAVANSMENWLILRFFNVFGPGQKDHFLDEFIARVNQGEYCIYGDDSRSFCFVDDAVALTIAAAETCSNEIINIGNPSEYKISDVARLVMSKMGIDPKLLEINPGRLGSAKRRCPDVSKILKRTNYKYRFDLGAGLDELIRGQWS